MYEFREEYVTGIASVDAEHRRLFEIADSFEELPSYCECGNKNSVNARIDNNGIFDFKDGNQIEIGGDTRYKSICRKCFTKAFIENMQLADEI